MKPCYGEGEKRERKEKGREKRIVAYKFRQCDNALSYAEI